VPAKKTESQVYMRIGELAERAGVSIATIKFYIREGLLPPASKKTGRTMAFYDQAYLERLQLVRSLREEHFLPLRVIRAVLAERGARPLDRRDREILGRVAPDFLSRLAATAGTHATRAELVAGTELSSEELAMLEELGLVGADAGDGERRYDADDRALIEALQALERAGVSRDRFPLEILGHHVELLGELSRREVRTFIHNAGDLEPTELAKLAERALALVGPILALVHRKLIQRALRAELAKEKPR